MAGIVPVFIFLGEATIYAFLDLALYLVDLGLCGGVWTPSHHRSCKLGFESEVHLDHCFSRQGWGQPPKPSWYFWMSLLRRGSRFMLSSASTKSASALRLLFIFSCFFIHPMVSGGSSSSHFWQPC